MKKVESLNSAIGEKDVMISSLQSELEDLKEQYQALQNSYSEKVRKFIYCSQLQGIQLIFTCLNLTIETLEKGVKYVWTKPWKHLNDFSDVVLVYYC